MHRAPDFLQQLLGDQSWRTAHRQLRLRSAKGGLGNLMDVLLPQHIVGWEAICGGIDYRIACMAGTSNLPLKELIALPVEIQFVTDRGLLRSVCGIVTEARAGDADGGLAAYHLVVRDALAIMEKRINSRIFRNLNELDIVRVLFDEWRHSNAVFAGAFEYELESQFDMAQFPPREQTLQCNESDASFVRRLLKRRGISWTIRPGRCRTSALLRADDRIPAHTLVLFKNATSLPLNAAGTVRYHREDATDGRDVITHWTGKRTLQPGKTNRHSWDYKNPRAGQIMTASARNAVDQGSYGNELAATLDDYQIETPHAGNDVEDHQRLGQLRMSRHEFESKCFHGEGGVRDFCAGEYFVLAGHPEIDTHPQDEREFVITEIEIEARNNLPGDMAARVERLLAGGRRPADAPAHVRFSAVRRGVPVVPHFDPRIDLPHPQLQSAIVVGPPGEDVHCDEHGRVKVRFPGMREADHLHAHGAGASNSPADSAWVRVASGWAGNGQGTEQQCGTLTLPRVGTEVLLTFLGGDPDKAVITSQVFNFLSMPPAFSGVGKLPGNRYLSGMRTHEIRGQRGNQLRFDDTSGEISAQLASDHGASELNLGWLTRPRVDGMGAPRGEGAELRSGHAVAIRGEEGVLITAEASDKGKGPQLARAGLIGLADLLQGVVDQVGKLAEHHSGDEGTAGLAALADKIRHWHDGSNVAPNAKAGGAPIVAVTAPAGIVLASPDSVAIGAEKKLALASAGDAEVSAGRNVFVRAARGISAFAHALGIKLIAASGNVTMQTHNGDIEIKSAGRITLVAAKGIDLHSPEIKVVAQGAQTNWGQDRIAQQCTGTHAIKAARFVRLDPGGGTPAALNLPSSKVRTDERLILRDGQTDEPVRNQRYLAYLHDGSTVDGITDDKGRTTLALSDVIGNVRFEFLPD